MTKHEIKLEWDDAGDQIPTDTYLLEVLSVHPFQGEKAVGWELVLKPVSLPDMRLKDWLTIKIKEKALAWKLGKTHQFLEAAGLDKKPHAVTHRDLLGLKIKAFVKKAPRKLRGGIERIESRVSRYIPNNATGKPVAKKAKER